MCNLLVKNRLIEHKYIFALCLLLSSLSGFCQVEAFKTRIDEQMQPLVKSRAEELLLNRDSILNRDSVLYYPLYLFTQGIDNMDKEKYNDYSFLNGLKWNGLLPNYSIYPFELMVTDLEGKLICLFTQGKDNTKDLRKHSPYGEYTNHSGDEVLKRLVVKLLHHGIFDYVFVTSVPVIEEKTKEVYQQERAGMCFCVKNGHVYVLFQNCQLFTMEDFVKHYWEWFDVKVSDTYSGQSTEEAPCTIP